MTPAQTEVAGLRVDTLTGLTELDSLIFGEHDVFALSENDAAELRLEAVRRALAFHLEHSPEYARFATAYGFSLDELTRPDQLDDVPQFPAAVFKRRPPRSVPQDHIVRAFTSSGTQGRVSVVPRDETTLSRLMGSMQANLVLLDELTADRLDDGCMVNLGPDRAEAGDLWFSFTMSLIEWMLPAEHYVREQRLLLAEAARDLRDRLGERHSVVALTGSPAMVARLAEHVRGFGPPIEGGATLIVITGGGWKRSEEETIARDRFNEMVADAFGLSSPSRIRDGFNLVELNTVLFECQAQRKHVPPWLHVTVRAPGDLRPLPHGEEGLLCYLDPSAQSYPCFIVTDDVGVLRIGSCECGHSGRTLEVLRRIRRLAHQGCALELEAQVGERHGD